MKTWYLSKTLWVNIIAAIALLVQTQTGFIVDAEAQAGILAVINLILRLITSTGLTTGAQENSQTGFARIACMVVIALVMGAMLLVSGCASGPKGSTTTPAASDSPVILAGKSLLTVKASITTAATAVDSFCKAGKISADKCAQAKDAYSSSKSAYDSAVDAYLLMVQGGDPAKFGESLQRVQNIAATLLKYTVVGGAP
jgi:hypothetical protein